MNSEAHKIADRAAVILAAMVVGQALRPESPSTQKQAVRTAIALQELAKEYVEATFSGATW